MAILHSPRIVTDGLVFYYDMNNTKKSFVGAPTTNYAYLQNPRIDSSYAPYSATASGTWNAKHSDAIRVYATDGSEITGYANTGVTDWTNTYHAIWTYDQELGKPVVTMRDFDGQWKAKSWGWGYGTFASLGMTVGTQYTISWLQWTDNLTKRANVGFYTRNSSLSTNFWDGLSNGSASSTNTKLRTWQRVYHTYTVTSNWNQSDSYGGIYMYGMDFVNNATVKISDVQFELLPYASGFHNGQTRSNTQSLLDLTGRNTITTSSLTYNSDGSFSFNGSSNFIIFPENSALNTQTPTVEVWVKTNATNQNGFWFEKGQVNTQYALFQEGANITWRHTTNVSSLTAPAASYINTSQYAQIVGTYTAGDRRIYVNGVQVASDALNYTIPTNANGSSIGVYGGFNGSRGYYYNGNIAIVKVYNRALSAAEVNVNFNALRGRFGI